MAYERIEGPIGALRDDYLNARVLAAIAQTNARKGKRFRISEFMPKWDRGPRNQTPQDMLRTVRRWNRRLGGVDRSKEVSPDGDA